MKINNLSVQVYSFVKTNKFSSIARVFSYQCEPEHSTIRTDSFSVADGEFSCFNRDYNLCHAVRYILTKLQASEPSLLLRLR